LPNALPSHTADPASIATPRNTIFLMTISRSLELTDAPKNFHQVFVSLITFRTYLKSLSGRYQNEIFDEFVKCKGALISFAARFGNNVFRLAALIISLSATKAARFICREKGA
jgi:hypothetical protein